MENPFLVTSPNGYKYIDNNCSINKMVIAKVPVKGIDDSIEGKAVSEIFSTSVIVEKVKECADRLEIPPNTPTEHLPFMLLELMNSENKQVSDCANEIAVLFGKRLGLIFLTLKTALPQNKKVRADWDEKHWQYWQNIENIITVGGLTSGKFGKVIIDEAQKVCNLNSKPVYKITAFENASHVGVMGCTKLLGNYDGISIVMDFGQTNMKRSIIEHKNGEIIRMENLPSIPSKYMQWNIENSDEKEKQARLLHKYIVNAVSDAYSKAKKLGSVGSDIIISIANYTFNGVLDSNRGGYAKLSVLYKNYAEYLSNELSSVIKAPVNVRLIHDGTAVALNFINYKNSICVTLGTFLGVGFTDIFGDF